MLVFTQEAYIFAGTIYSAQDGIVVPDSNFKDRRKSASSTNNAVRGSQAARGSGGAPISLEGRPAVRLERQGKPLDPSITEEQVSLLVEAFYDKIRQHPRLAPLFDAGMSLEWPEHLEIMKSFWRSLLMQTREYSGRPVPAHMKLTNLQPQDFAQWLDLFRQTATETCPASAAALYIGRAETIAKSLQMAVFLKGRVAPVDAFENGVMTETWLETMRLEEAQKAEHVGE